MVLQKLVLCVPFLRGWWGSCGQQIQASVQGAMQQMLVGRHNLRLLDEAGSRALAAGQETTENSRNPQKTADWGLSP